MRRRRRSRGADIGVGFVAHSSGSHGAQRAFVELVQALHRRGVRCFAVVPERGWTFDALTRAGIGCRRFAYKWWAMPASPARRCARGAMNVVQATRIAAHFRRCGVDLVFTNTSVVPVGALAAWLLRKPHVWYLHELIGERWVPFDLGPRWTLRLIDRMSRVVLVGSKSLRDRLAPSLPTSDGPIVVPPVFAAPAKAPGVTAEPERSELAPVPTLVIVGWLGEGKGQLDAVRAVGELVASGLDVRLEVLGHGSARYERALREEARARRVHSHVRLRGHVDDAARARIVQGASAALACGVDETFGRATLEAMALGKPVIAARIPATQELIREGWNGLLYQPGDSLELAEKIRQVLGNASFADELGSNASSWFASSFSVERNVDRVFEVLEACRAHVHPGPDDERSE